MIATGSAGNAVVINGNIPIDCGVPFRSLETVKKNLKLVLLTHVRGDHFKPRTVRALRKERPALRWGCCEWMVRPLMEAGVDKRVIDVYDPELPAYMMYGPHISIRPQRLVHDAPNCGYHMIFTPEHEKRERMFYATDTAALDGVEAKDYSGISSRPTTPGKSWRPAQGPSWRRASLPTRSAPPPTTCPGNRPLTGSISRWDRIASMCFCINIFNNAIARIKSVNRSRRPAFPVLCFDDHRPPHLPPFPPSPSPPHTPPYSLPPISPPYTPFSCGDGGELEGLFSLRSEHIRTPPPPWR